MITTKALNDVERRVLALLNESGEEYVSVLLNSIFRVSGAPTELFAARDALRTLMTAGVVVFATTRDDTTLTWQLLPPAAALTSLNSLDSTLVWSSRDHIWENLINEPRMVAILTADGIDLSNRVLEEFGWKLTEPI